MSAFKEMAAALCTGLIVCGAVFMLLPNDEGKKPLKLLVSLFILLTLCSPFLTGGWSFDGVAPAWEDGAQTAAADLGETYRAQLKDASAAQITALIEATLRAEAIAPLDTRVDMDILDDGSISINNVSLTVPQGQGGKARQKLKQELGLDADVVESRGTG